MGILYFVFPAETTNICSSTVAYGIPQLARVKHLGFAEPRDRLRQPSIQQHGDAIACKTSNVGTVARADGRLTIRAALDLFQKTFGKFVQICHFKTHYEYRWCTVQSALHSARFARILANIGDLQTVALQ